jgi:hypothetical protein
VPVAVSIRLCIIAVIAVGLFGGCSARLYEGEARRREDVAVIDVGTTIVRQIDGQARRGGALDVGTFEVQPGPHRLRLVFELPSRNMGMKILPAQPGIGVCDLTFDAQAGHRYYLGARAVGDINDPRWPGTWEGWVRDPAVSELDDIVARCLAAEPAVEATPAVATAPAAPPSAAVPAPASPAAPVIAAPAVVARGAIVPPAGSALRVGAWRLPALADASTADLAGLAPAIEAGFDALTIEPAFDAGRLLGLLGPAWATAGAADQTVLYRRALVRPCARPSPAALCLEAIATTPAGEGRPLLLHLQPAQSRP